VFVGAVVKFQESTPSANPFRPRPPFRKKMLGNAERMIILANEA
jgi:hypothetical protein